MDLPPLLRRAVDDALEGVKLAELAAAAEAMSQRYRAERAAGGFYLAEKRAVQAYLATRLPATYAAVRSAFTAAGVARPDFTPRTMLDAGAGPGTALWAAAACWPSLGHRVPWPIVSAFPHGQDAKPCGHVRAQCSIQHHSGRTGTLARSISHRACTGPIWTSWRH
jgi:hypothetical protein